ncbi:LysR family transcriptional regulator [Streptomyces sp. NPDC021093]|uniref:LysR family transcriptional regulator n=1 Tax=Streptomyces sp. NPDC021093 TaxID=3365112 RepID=UPI0037B2223D
MELRDIEIFLTLVEELHFGRTAERLHVSPARVSQAIKKQERRIGGDLFERDSRNVRLTPLGEQLRDDLGAGYRQIIDGIKAATATAASGFGRLVLGLFGPHAHELAPAIALFRDRYPACDLTFREIHFSDPFGPLRSGDIDLQTCWLPVREPDLTVGPVVLTEPVVLMTAASHPLAGRESVSLEDLGDWAVPEALPPVPEYWEGALNPFHTPSGRPVPRGPKVTTFQETLAVVAAEQAVCVVHGETVRYYERPGISFVPVRDAPPGKWGLIWRSARQDPLVRGFARAAQDTGAPHLNSGTGSAASL